MTKRDTFNINLRKTIMSNKKNPTLKEPFPGLKTKANIKEKIIKTKLISLDMYLVTQQTIIVQTLTIRKENAVIDFKVTAA